MCITYHRGLVFWLRAWFTGARLAFFRPWSLVFLALDSSRCLKRLACPLVRKPLWPLGDAVVVAVGAGRGPHGSQSYD